MPAKSKLSRKVGGGMKLSKKSCKILTLVLSVVLVLLVLYLLNKHVLKINIMEKFQEPEAEGPAGPEVGTEPEAGSGPEVGTEPEPEGTLTELVYPDVNMENDMGNEMGNDMDMGMEMPKSAFMLKNDDGNMFPLSCADNVCSLVQPNLKL